MPDNVKITAMVATLIAMLGSWYLDVDPVLQKTFLSLFLASVAWTPFTAGLKAVAYALKIS